MSYRVEKAKSNFNFIEYHYHPFFWHSPYMSDQAEHAQLFFTPILFLSSTCMMLCMSLNLRAWSDLYSHLDFINLTFILLSTRCWAKICANRLCYKKHKRFFLSPIILLYILLLITWVFIITRFIYISLSLKHKDYNDKNSRQTRHVLTRLTITFTTTIILSSSLYSQGGRQSIKVTSSVNLKLRLANYV